MNSKILLADLKTLPIKEILSCGIGEAGGEGIKGMKAVFEVMRKRNSINGFYGCEASHVYKEPKWVWSQAGLAWRQSAKSNDTKGATHFESVDFPAPVWAKDMQRTVRIGRHQFYREIK